MTGFPSDAHRAAIKAKAEAVTLKKMSEQERAQWHAYHYGYIIADGERRGLQGIAPPCTPLDPHGQFRASDLNREAADWWRSKLKMRPDPTRRAQLKAV